MPSRGARPLRPSDPRRTRERPQPVTSLAPPHSTGAHPLPVVVNFAKAPSADLIRSRRQQSAAAALVKSEVIYVSDGELGRFDAAPPRSFPPSTPPAPCSPTLPRHGWNCSRSGGPATNPSSKASGSSSQRQPPIKNAPLSLASSRSQDSWRFSAPLMHQDACQTVAGRSYGGRDGKLKSGVYIGQRQGTQIRLGEAVQIIPADRQSLPSKDVNRCHHPCKELQILHSSGACLFRRISI